MTIDDRWQDDNIVIEDDERQPYGKNGIVYTMTPDEYRKYCEKYKRMEKRVCPKCGSKMLLRNGPYGEFFGCSRFPKCKYKEGLLR